LPITTIFEVIFSVFFVSVGLTAGEGDTRGLGEAEVGEGATRGLGDAEVGEGETRGLGDAVGEIEGVGLGEISGLAWAIA
jgi:hypothetical protein